MNKPAAENDDFSAFLYENQDTPFSPIIETPSSFKLLAFAAIAKVAEVAISLTRSDNFGFMFGYIAGFIPMCFKCLKCAAMAALVVRYS